MSKVEASQQELDYETALALIRREHGTAWKRLIVFLVAGYGAIVLFLISVWMNKVEARWPTYLGSTLLAVTGLVAYVRTMPRLPENVTLRDTRLIAPLLDNLNGAMGERRANLKRWLKELLPLMTEQDADALSKSQQFLLIEELFDDGPSGSEEYRLVVLDALKNVADGRALAKVRWLAELGLGFGYAPALCTTAQEIAPQLEALMSEREKRAGLLLPSSAEEVGSATLLRASAPQAGTTDSAQLLRAGAGKKNLA